MAFGFMATASFRRRNYYLRANRSSHAGAPCQRARAWNLLGCGKSERSRLLCSRHSGREFFSKHHSHPGTRRRSLQCATTALLRPKCFTGGRHSSANNAIGWTHYSSALRRSICGGCSNSLRACLGDAVCVHWRSETAISYCGRAHEVLLCSDPRGGDPQRCPEYFSNPSLRRFRRCDCDTDFLRTFGNLLDRKS